MPQETLLGMTLATSARYGSLLIPAASLQSHLGKAAFPLITWAHHETYKVSLRGSAIGLFHDDRPLLICSRHQIVDMDFEDVGMMLPDGSHFITSAGSRSFRDGAHLQESDAYDLVAFNFSEPATQHPELVKDFFKFTQVPPDISNDQILAFVVAGFPSNDQKYELAEKNHLGTVRRVMTAEPDDQSVDPALLRLRFTEGLDFEPDGLSGGPAFVVQMHHREPTVFLAGMIVRAGKTHCYLLKVRFIWDFITASF